MNGAGCREGGENERGYENEKMMRRSLSNLHKVRIILFEVGFQNLQEYIY